MIYVIGESLGNGAGYSSSHRMADLLGVSREAFLRDVLWLNMYDQPFSDPAKMVSLIDSAAVPQKDAVILLGRKVAIDWHMGELPPLALVRRHGGMGVAVLTLPHPSGLNRWWNKTTNAAMAKDALLDVWSKYR